jgi:hypothetical protein
VAIWAHARDGNFIIVSKDDDFRSLALVRGPPPKAIWLQVGNASTAVVANLLRANALLLKTFSVDPVEALLSLQGLVREKRRLSQQRRPSLNTCICCAALRDILVEIYDRRFFSTCQSIRDAYFIRTAFRHQFCR